MASSKFDEPPPYNVPQQPQATYHGVQTPTPGQGGTYVYGQLPSGDSCYAPGPQMYYGQQQQQQQLPPTAGGYYGPQGGYPPQGAYPGYGGPGYYYQGHPQGQYQQQNQRGNIGFMETCLASLACCCCLDLLLF